MKLSILQENLAKGLSIVSRSVATRAQLPVLSNILLATDRGRLKLSATNLEMGINYWIGAKVEKEGSLSVPAKVLTEFVSSLSPEKIEIKSQESSLEITSGSHQANFVGMVASEFPSVPSLKGKPKISFDLKALSAAISQVAFAAAQDEGNPVLTGVLLITKGKNLILVATDGYRLSLKKIESGKTLVGVKEFEKGLIIPSRTLTEVGKVIGESGQEKILGLNLTPESNQVIFVTPDCEIVSRIVEGKFPDFEKIIPEEEKTKAIVETGGLTRAVKIAAIFARESANIVRFEVDRSGIKVSANTAQVGENKSQIEAKVEGESNKIAFNSRYFLDFLNSVNSDLIEFRMTGPLNPGVFSPAGDKSYTHIIMPVRVQE